MEFPIGAGEITLTGTGGITFEDKRDVIVYNSRYVVLVQTSASTYRPKDTMEVRVIVTNEELIPVEKCELLIEIYDAGLKLIGSFPQIPVRSGMTETMRFPIAGNANFGTWLVSATVANRTSSVEVLVAEPVNPSFDLKAIFPRFLLRTEKFLRGIIEIDSDDNIPIFGRGFMAASPITEENLKEMMKEQQESPKSDMKKPMIVNEEWRNWKRQEFEIAGRLEFNYDMWTLFGIDVSKVLAVQIKMQVTDLASGQERLLEQIIPIFSRDVVYDIRPLEFEAGIKNEFQVIAKRPDGKPAKMEDMIVSISMMMGDDKGKVKEERKLDVTEFYTRGRNDVGLFNLEIPENCIGVLMTITPLGDDGKVRGYRTRTVPLMPSPRHTPRTAKLTIELLPASFPSVEGDAKSPLITSQVSTAGRTSSFYVQLLPNRPVERFEPLPMSYMILTNGRISSSGQFNIEPTKECQSKAKRTIEPEVQQAPTCVFNGTLAIPVTRAMIPYSTLLVYTFQPTFGFNVAESYRFSVGGLFRSSLNLNATIVPYTSETTMAGDMNHDELSVFEGQLMNPLKISERAQDKTRVELSFTGTSGATVGLNVIEYDGVMQGLSGEITKERVLQYLTAYEQVPIVGMPSRSEKQSNMRTRTMDALFETKPVDESSTTTTTAQPSKRAVTEPMGETMEFTTVSSKKRESHDSEEMTTSTLSERSFDQSFEHTTVESTNSDASPSSEQTMTKRRVLSAAQEQQEMELEDSAFRLRYPFEKMVFGINGPITPSHLEGDDIYSSSNMERFYGDEQKNDRSSAAFHYRRKSMKAMNQYDVTVNDNNYVVATSIPASMLAEIQAVSMEHASRTEKQSDIASGDDMREVEDNQESGRTQGSPAWYEKLNSKLALISPEAYVFMQSGLSIVSDFESLNLPADMRRVNLTQMFSRYRTQSNSLESQIFSDRDDARQILEEYLAESGVPMGPPPMMLEEQARNGYYQSAFFNTSRIGTSGTGKVVLPRIKPYSTWLATGFSLHTTGGLAIAQPIRLPSNQGLFILGNFPDQVQLGEQVLLTYGINNYLGKDLTNVVIRIRGTEDFDLLETNKPDRVLSTAGQDYIITIPSFKSLAVEVRNITVVPKRSGFLRIVIEVESEFGGDYEVITSFVRESGIPRRVVSANLYDLSDEKKPVFPVKYDVEQSPFLRSVRVTVSGTGIDRLIRRFAVETSNLIGLDRAIIRLWRHIGLRSYLNQTSQFESQLDDIAESNISMSMQELQIYNRYDGSYTFISDSGEKQSSLYLTTLAFGALASPYMTVRDWVTLNRTVEWILSRQQEDGSFEDNGPCYHQRFCSGEFRRESLTALFLYIVNRDNIESYLPETIRRELFEGEQSPVARATRYLESRYPVVKPCMMTTVLVELALCVSPAMKMEAKQKIFESVRARQLTVVPENGSKFFKYTENGMNAEDMVLTNSMLLSIYSIFDDFKTTSQIARWIVSELQVRPCYDTVLDSVFATEAWVRTIVQSRKQFPKDKFLITVDVSADNGEKFQFTINHENMDFTQKYHFKLPVKQITYSATGLGMFCIQIRSVYIEKQQKAMEPNPFQLTNEMKPAPWLNEIQTKTCFTYTPEQKFQSKDKTANRTIVIEYQLPTGKNIIQNKNLIHSKHKRNHVF